MIPHVAPGCSGLVAPSCNVATVEDGRGGIFTYLPDEPIVEFNYMFIRAGKQRGHHFHPHFDEYFLLVSGSALFLWREQGTDESHQFLLAPGQCVLNRAGSAHRLMAIEDCQAIAMLTRKWDDCDPPIVFDAVK